MSINAKGILKTIGIGAAAFGIAKAGELWGFVKGTVHGCRIARDNPEDAVQVAENWDEIDRKWDELKEELKYRRA